MWTFAFGLLSGAALLYAYRLRELTWQLQVANEALGAMAAEDPITGLANRRRFDVFLQQEWQRARRTRRPLSMLLLDIDHFKKYNDRYGHPAGDACIRQVAAIMREVAHRPSDLCCRYGGEEFAVVLPETDAAGALAVAEQIRKKVEATGLPHAEVPGGIVTVSIGYATAVGRRYAGVRAFLEACDEALYESKADGRNQTQTDETTAI